MRVSWRARTEVGLQDCLAVAFTGVIERSKRRYLARQEFGRRLLAPALDLDECCDAALLSVIGSLQSQAQVSQFVF